MLCACTSDGDVPVPKPYAWPRIDLYPTEYSCMDSLDASFCVNSGATVIIKDRGERGAADIVYPRYGATVYVTVLSRVKDLDAEVAGRKERIARNLGDKAADRMLFTSADSTFNGIVVSAKSLSQTPVQLAAINRPKGIVVSATAFFEKPLDAGSYDSIAPIIEALRVDMDSMARSLTICR